MIYNDELTIKQKLGLIIREHRMKQKLSQSDLAEQLIYDQSVVSRIEKGYDEIPLEVYHLSLSLFGLEFKPKVDHEIQIIELINRIFLSYEHLLITDFNDYLKQVDLLLQENTNAILNYDLLVLKMTCVYMLSRYPEAQEIIEELTLYVGLIQPKCHILYHVIKTQLILMHTKRNNRSLEHKIPLRKDSEHGLIQYMWAKYYLYIFNFSKAITHINKSLEFFHKENNKQRIMRCELMTNEICITEHQFYFVKQRALKLFFDLEAIHPYDIFRLHFQLGYCEYHLGEYDNCLKTFSALEFESFYEFNFITHIKHKALAKLSKPLSFDFEQVNTSNVLDYLYFYYLEHSKDDSYYELIEKYLVEEFEINYFKTEVQIYIKDLLEYWYLNKKYQKYKQLSDKIRAILHFSS